jgi:hypothetical protein
VFIKTIKYYENTNCTLKKGKKKSAQFSCVEGKLQKGCTRLAADIAEILLKVALKHQKIKSKADYINNHILNVFKYIFNIFINYL